MRHGLLGGVRVTDRSPKTAVLTTRFFSSRILHLGTRPQWLSLPSATDASATSSPQIITDISPLSTRWKALPSRLSFLGQQKRWISKFTLRAIYKSSLRNRSELVDPGRMQSHVQILTTPTADTPGTGLLLIFEDKRYFFGQAHEGLQRAGLEQGAKYVKLTELFLTGTSRTENVGGLFGLILTTADALKSRLESDRENLRTAWKKFKSRTKEEEERNARGLPSNAKTLAYLSRTPPSEVKAPRLGIHGAPNLKHFIATARGYIFRQEVPLDVEEFADSKNPPNSETQWESTWADEHIRVWAIGLNPDVESTSPLPAGGMGHSRKRSLDEYVGSDQDELTGIVEQVSESKDQFEHPVSPDDVIRNMFQSKWRPNQMEEKYLWEVVLPAKLFVRDPVTQKLCEYQGPLPGGTEPLPDTKVLVRKPWPAPLYSTLQQVKPSRVAISYIIRNQKQRGKFKPELAKAFGIRLGPLCSDLANGKAVVSPTGTLITPEMVMDSGKEGAGFAVIDLPSRDYISAFIQRPEWDNANIMEEVKVFFWILGPGVAGEESLSKFMENHTDQKHIVSSSDLSPDYLAMRTAAKAAVRNQSIDPARFSTLRFSNEKSRVPSKTVDGSQLPPNAEIAKPGLKIYLAPSFKIRDDEAEVVNLGEVLEQTPSNIRDLVKQAHADVENARRQQNALDSSLPFPDAEIVCLGTGSAAPSPYRNVSGTLLRIPGHGSYLFDAGENTLGQLRRKYSQQDLSEILRDLKMIWNSHLHADHHLGVIPIIKAWHEEVHGETPDHGNSAEEQSMQNVIDYIKEDKCLFVVCGPDLRRAIYERGWTEPVCHSRRLVVLEPQSASPPNFDKSRLLYRRENDLGLTTSQTDDVKSAMRDALGLSDLVVCSVSHCARAMAISITFANGFKFSYSGDCRPSHGFAKMGVDSTVLVHEATFDDELRADAKAKKHSTISEAIRVGVQMGAKNILLTHFSQRFSKIPSMDEVVIKYLASPELARQDEDMDESPVDEVPLDEIGLLSEQDAGSGNVQPGSRPRTPGSDSPLSERTSAVHQNDQIDILSPSRVSEKNKPPSDFRGGRSPTPAFPEDPSARSSDINIAVAFDYMSVKVKDIQYLKYFIPAFCEIYKDEEKSAVEAGNEPRLLNEEPGDTEKAVVANVGGSGNTNVSLSKQPPKGIEKVMEKELRKAEKRKVLEEQKRVKVEAKARRLELHQPRHQEEQRQTQEVDLPGKQAERSDLNVELGMDVDVGAKSTPIPLPPPLEQTLFPVGEGGHP